MTRICLIPIFICILFGGNAFVAGEEMAVDWEAVWYDNGWYDPGQDPIDPEILWEAHFHRFDGDKDGNFDHDDLGKLAISVLGAPLNPGIIITPEHPLAEFDYTGDLVIDVYDRKELFEALNDWVGLNSLWASFMGIGQTGIHCVFGDYDDDGDRDLDDLDAMLALAEDCPPGFLPFDKGNFNQDADQDVEDFIDLWLTTEGLAPDWVPER